MFRTTFCILFLVVICNPSSAFPQGWPEKTFQKQEDDWKSKSSEGRGYGGDSDAEMIPSEILEQNKEYNLVRYPASKWICNKKTVDVTEDYMKGWREKFNNDAMAAMRDKKKNRKGKGMFMKLFRYIIGVNSQNVEIDMTRPVTTIRKPVKGSPNLEEKVMCFWTGTPWANKELPQPMDKSLFIQYRPQVDVFVRRFGGWAFSEEDWSQEKQKLMKSLSYRMNEVDMDYYATVGYDSPWTQENRRNEVWLVKKKSSDGSVRPNKDKVTSVSSAGSSTGYEEEEDYETVPYQVVETKNNYEIRQYPATKWICTTMNNIDPSADGMNGWQEKFDNDAFKAMSSKLWKKQPSSKMFMKLFKYIAGANMMGEEVKMTTPVPTKHTPEFNDLEEQVMCFWLGTPWQSKPAPKPLPKDAQSTKIVEGQPLKVYVRKFGGWAMSHDDWTAQYDVLKSDLKTDQAQFKDDGVFYHLSYNSPWEQKNRRNEVWVEVGA